MKHAPIDNRHDVSHVPYARKFWRKKIDEFTLVQIYYFIIIIII